MGNDRFILNRNSDVKVIYIGTGQFQLASGKWVDAILYKYKGVYKMMEASEFIKLAEIEHFVLLAGAYNLGFFIFYFLFFKLLCVYRKEKQKYFFYFSNCCKCIQTRNSNESHPGICFRIGVSPHDKK